MEERHPTRCPGRAVLTLGLMAMLGGGPGLAAQAHHLTGLVADRATGAVLSGVTVRLGDSLLAVSQADGVFTVGPAAPGMHRLVAAAPGYATAEFTFTIDAAMPVAIDVGLVPLRALPPVELQVAGSVFDSLSGQPIPNAEVFIAGDPAASTDAAGGFSVTVSLSPGPHLVLIRALGYRLAGYELNVSQSGTVRLDAPLAEAPFTLAGIEVVERDGVRGLGGFLQRMESEIGQFLTPADVAELRKRSLTTSELIARVPGIMVRPTRYGRVVSLARCGRPELFLDGQPLEAAELDDVIPVEHLAAVEVYSDPGRIPPQFNRLQPRRGRNNYGACGAILFWTIIGRNDGR